MTSHVTFYETVFNIFDFICVILRHVCNICDFTSVILRRVFNICGFISVMLRCVFNMFDFTNVTLRRVFNIFDFISVILRLVFHICDFMNVILRRVLNIFCEKTLIPYDVFSKVVILYEFLNVTFQKARVFSSEGPRGTEGNSARLQRVLYHM